MIKNAISARLITKLAYCCWYQQLLMLKFLLLFHLVKLNGIGNGHSKKTNKNKSVISFLNMITAEKLKNN